MLTRQLTLKASGRKPPDLGPKVRVEAVHLSPAGDDTGLAALVNGAGLRDWDKNGLLKHDTDAKHMWRGACTTNLNLEFELPEPVALGAIEVWNYNAEWQTADGVRKADVAVSPDGTTWQTVLRGAEFAEAEGNADYDEPIRLKLSGATVRKVRFENIVPWSASGKVGLSAVVFHQAMGAQAGPRQPEDGATSIGIGQLALDWVAGQGATEHRVCLGTAADNLALIGTTKNTRLDAPQLKPDTTYFWRVDEAQADGSVITGRVARFQTSGLVAWWKLDETKGSKAEDATGHQFTGNVVGKANWAPEQGRIGGALDFDGKTTFINCGKAPEFDFRDGMTVAAWIKVREFNRAFQPIVTKGDTAWRLQRQKDTGMVEFIFDTRPPAENDDRNLVGVTSKRRVDDGQWHHLAGVSDGRRVALYVDGELEASADAKPIAPNREPVMIGCNSEAYGRRFNGWIDDVRLYGYGLSEAEIKALYRSGGEASRAEK
ncbi:MAG: LamG-like jellyroll fold domain-containing protein [Verrucomicrobiota bacterium]